MIVSLVVLYLSLNTIVHSIGGFSNYQLLATLRKKHFACSTKDTRSFIKPQTVHNLKPGDFDVIAALGDDYTSGFGAKATILNDMMQSERGVSWSAGAEYPDLGILLTLPNILKKYNPDLVGYSWGPGDVTSPASGFNMAQTGENSQNLLKQAVALVESIRSSNQVDFYESWKLVTVFIGVNDLCDYCRYLDLITAEKYVENVKKSLDYLHANLPRTLVNLVLNPDWTRMGVLNDSTCPQLYDECNCVLNTSTISQSAKMSRDMNKGLVDLINSGVYDVEDSFSVIVQPFMEQYSPPMTANSENPDYSYFAPDCFRFSIRGQSMMAIELWNNMIQPIGYKNKGWSLFDQEIPCPTFPFIYTNKNSDLKCVDLIAYTYCYQNKPLLNWLGGIFKQTN